MSDGDRWIRAALRLYRLALRLYPRGYRERFADDQLRSFSDQCRAALRRRGRRGLPRLWVRAFLDLLVTATRERLGSRGRPGPAPGRDRPWGLAAALDALGQDLRFTLRSLRGQPGHSLAVVATIGVGILGVATVYSAVDAVLLRPLPYADSSELVALTTDHPEEGVVDGPVSLMNLREWRSLEGIFGGVAAMQGRTAVLTGSGEPARLESAAISAGTLELLGVETVLGRGFSSAEGVPGGDRVAILSHGLWRDRFGADPGILGETLTLDGRAHEVVGVLSAGVRLPLDLATASGRDLLVPLAPTPEEMPRSNRSVRGIARLEEGVDADRAREALQASFAAQAERHPAAHEGVVVRLRPLIDTVVGPYRPALRVLMGAASLLLLLGCANVTNLTLARSVGRRRETAIRLSLGAGRARVFGQLLLESVTLGAAGGLLGLLAARWSVDLLSRWSPDHVPGLDQAAVTPEVATLGLGSAVLAGMIFGSAPAWLAVRQGLAGAMKAGGNAASIDTAHRRTLGGLVSLQVALAVTLLVGAGLLARNFVSMVTADPGFDESRVLTVQVVLVPPAYPDQESRTGFVTRALDRFAALPGVEDAAVTNFLPFSGADTVDWITIQGRADEQGKATAGFRAVSAAYFDAMGIPVLEGRAFTADEVAGGTPVALINETMARRFWPDRDPVGQRLVRGSPSEEKPWLEIVGVVGDVRHGGPAEVPRAEWYVPYPLDPYPLKAFAMRTAVPAAGVARAARRELTDLDPELAPLEVRTLERYVEEHVAEPRFNLATLGGFAAIAVLLASIGTSAMLAHSVSRRIREVGVRMALGAHRGQIVRRVVGEGLRLAGLGIALGLGAALALARLLETLLVDVAPTDPLTLAGVVLTMLVLAAASSYVAAREASRIDPVIALRSE